MSFKAVIEDTIAQKIEEIKKYEKVVPYKYGGNTTAGWDCSGFTQWALNYLGVSIPRTASEQSKGGVAININDMSLWQPGEVLCYSLNGKITHAALYLGDGMLMHALNNETGTVIHSVAYYERIDTNTLATVRRYL